MDNERPQNGNAGQGRTIEDFWQMVWEQETKLIVMVTKLKEVNYKKGKLDGATTGWFESGEKAYEHLFQLGELVGLNEWDVNGTKVRFEKKKDFSGRKRVWAEGELEKFYPKQSEGILELAFGEPDDYEGGVMVYNNIVVKDRNCSIRFTLKFGLIEKVEVAPMN